MRLTAKQIEFRDELEGMIDNIGSALVLPDDETMEVVATYDKAEVRAILSEMGVRTQTAPAEASLPIDRKAILKQLLFEDETRALAMARGISVDGIDKMPDQAVDAMIEIISKFRKKVDEAP